MQQPQALANERFIEEIEALVADETRKDDDGQ